MKLSPFFLLALLPNGDSFPPKSAFKKRPIPPLLLQKVNHPQPCIATSIENDSVLKEQYITQTDMYQTDIPNIIFQCEKNTDIEALELLEKHLNEHPLAPTLQKILPQDTVIIISQEKLNPIIKGYAHKGKNIIVLPAHIFKNLDKHVLSQISDCKMHHVEKYLMAPIMNILLHETAHLYEHYAFHPKADFHWKNLWEKNLKTTSYSQAQQQAFSQKKQLNLSICGYSKKQENRNFRLPKKTKQENEDFFNKACSLSEPIEKYGSSMNERWSTTCEIYSQMLLNHSNILAMAELYHCLKYNNYPEDTLEKVINLKALPEEAQQDFKDHIETIQNDPVPILKPEIKEKLYALLEQVTSLYTTISKEEYHKHPHIQAAKKILEQAPITEEYYRKPNKFLKFIVKLL